MRTTMNCWTKTKMTTQNLTPQDCSQQVPVPLLRPSPAPELLRRRVLQPVLAQREQSRSHPAP